MKKLVIILTTLAFITVLLVYSQYFKKSLISAVLQYQVDVNNPPNTIFAISTVDQKLTDRKVLPKGTRLIGKLVSQEEGYVIYFDRMQTLNGKSEKFLAKAKLNIKEKTINTGVSARISKTLYQQTKTNVLGAIFDSSRNQTQHIGSILPRGYTLRVEVE